MIRLCLTFDVLQIDEFWDRWVDINMMTTTDAGELKPERFSTRRCISKSDIP